MKNRKLEFEWNLFVGKGLKVKFNNPLSGEGNEFIIDKIRFGKDYIDIYNPKFNIFYNVESYKPILKNPRNLTDEEWLYVFRGNKQNSFLIHNTGDYVNLVDAGGNVWNFYHFESCRISYCRQEQLSRFYEFSHPQFDELLRNGLIEELK